MIKLLRKHWPFLVILGIGIFLRSYKALDWFMYSHDQDLIGWIIRDVLENKHLRLIGQETTSKGVFVGPLFYYVLIPFYLLFKMDPIGGLFLPILISGFTIFSFYFVFSRVFNKKIGLIAAFIYAVSDLIVFTDREVVPTQPAMLWTVWFFYGISELTKGKQKAFTLVGVLLGLAWNFNLALIILAPLVLVAQILSKKKVSFKYVGVGLLALVITLSPFIIFEMRHDFSQTKAILSSLVSPKDYTEGTSLGFAKLDRVLQLVHKNTTSLVWDSAFYVPSALTFLGLVFLLLLIAIKKIIPRKEALLMFFWQGIYVVFFSTNALDPSEYYLNGMNVIWIAILALGLSRIKNRIVFYLLIFSFLGTNIFGFFKRAPNQSGYLERRALVDFILNDARTHDYPCISISYITSPGYDFGYRYFFYLADLHVNQPSSGAPPYTIVFPHGKVSRLDQTFGALGLVLPDYERYNEETVRKACSGENANLTDPMFGFVK